MASHLKQQLLPLPLRLLALPADDGGCCSAATYRPAACDGPRSTASNRSTTTTSYRSAASLPTWPPAVP